MSDFENYKDLKFHAKEHNRINFSVSSEFSNNITLFCRDGYVQYENK